MISVIIVSFNTCNILRQCLNSLFQDPSRIKMEVLVVDNNSHDGSAEMIKTEFPVVNLISNSENLGFAAANNQAFRQAHGDYVLLLNPDAFVKPGAISQAVAFMEKNPECGLGGGKLLSPDGELDPSARRFPSWVSKLLTITGIRARFPSSPLLNRHDFGGFSHDRPMEVDWVPGTFTIIRKAMLEEIGFFDERFYIYYEETDLCMRAKESGWTVFFTPDAEVIHIGGASSQTRKDQTYDPAASQVQSFRMRSEWLYFRKNKGLFHVLANAGVELGWHCSRIIFNLLPRKSARDKRTYSISTVKNIVDSLRDTRCGGSARQSHGNNHDSIQ